MTTMSRLRQLTRNQRKKLSANSFGCPPFLRPSCRESSKSDGGGGGEGVGGRRTGNGGREKSMRSRRRDDNDAEGERERGMSGSSLVVFILTHGRVLGSSRGQEKKRRAVRPGRRSNGRYAGGMLFIE